MDGRTDGWTEGRNHGQTDERTERRKLYTPQHTSYAGGIIKFLGKKTYRSPAAHGPTVWLCKK